MSWLGIYGHMFSACSPHVVVLCLIKLQRFWGDGRISRHDINMTSPRYDIYCDYSKTKRLDWMIDVMIWAKKSSRCVLDLKVPPFLTTAHPCFLPRPIILTCLCWRQHRDAFVTAIAQHLQCNYIPRVYTNSLTTTTTTTKNQAPVDPWEQRSSCEPEPPPSHVYIPAITLLLFTPRWPLSQ